MKKSTHYCFIASESQNAQHLAEKFHEAFEVTHGASCRTLNRQKWFQVWAGSHFCDLPNVH